MLRCRAEQPAVCPRTAEDQETKEHQLRCSARQVLSKREAFGISRARIVLCRSGFKTSAGDCDVDKGLIHVVRSDVSSLPWEGTPQAAG